MRKSQGNSEPIRVTYVTQWFDPEPMLKGASFVRELQTDDKVVVSVVTSFPSYPQGKIYPGYRQSLWRDDNAFGFPVRRVATYPDHGKSFFRRGLSYGSFFTSAMLQLLRLRARADVLLAYHPPVTTALAAVVAATIRRQKIVIDIQDLWPESLDAAGLPQNRIATWVVRKLVDFTYRQAHAIITGSEGLAGEIRARLPERDSRKVTVILNWCDETRIFGALPDGLQHAEVLGDSGVAFKIVFAGNLGFAQDLDCVLDAAKLLLDRGSKARLEILGTGPLFDHLFGRVQNEQLKNVELLGFVPPAEAGRAMAGAHALLVTLKGDPLFEKTIPSKCQAYLAAGKPIVVAVGGDAENLIVKEAAAGIAASPGDAVSLADAIAALESASPEKRARLGRNGRAFYLERLSLQNGARATRDVLCSAVAV